MLKSLSFMMTHMVSMPVGRCSNDTPYSSSALSTRRPTPSSLFIMAFSIESMVKPVWPAMPVIAESFIWFSLEMSHTIMVPGSEGSLVLRMLVGMPARRTGNTASSCSTVAPM